MAEKIEESFHTIDTEPEKTLNATTAELSIEQRNSSMPTTFSVNEFEILSEQFQNYLRIAQAILQTLTQPKDIEICTKILRQVQDINESQQLRVKRNNNEFFRYCLKVLKWTRDNQPSEFNNFWHRSAKPKTESCTWVEENKSYMALKCLKDGTNIIYAAVASDPSAGWQNGGLKIVSQSGSGSKT